MNTVFTLRETDGSYATGKFPDVTVYIAYTDSNIGIVEDTYNELNSSVDEIGNGDYVLSLDEPEDAYDYIRIHVTCYGCLDKRFTVYPSKDIGDIPRAVWEYIDSNGKSALYNIAKAVWSTRGASATESFIPSYFASQVVPFYFTMLYDIWHYPGASGNDGANTEFIQDDLIARIAREIWPYNLPLVQLDQNARQALCDAIWGRTSTDIASSSPSVRHKRTLTDYNIVNIANMAASSVWSHQYRQLTSATLMDNQSPHAVLATEGSAVSLTSEYDGAKLTTEELVAAIWGRESGDTTSRTLTSASLATTNEQLATVSSLSTITTAIAELPTSSEIAAAVMNSDNLQDIADTVLTTNVADLSVEMNDYTLKHLIMASQRSRVITEEGVTTWKILDADENATVIASRKLKLNANGAIVATNDVELGE